MKEIALIDGTPVFIDDEDFNLVKKYRWRGYSTQNSRTVYAKTIINRKTVSMHRLILGINNPKIQVDHKDLNGLNNQKSNLRPCTVSQNLYNITKKQNNTSGYKGVSFNKEKQMWVAKTKFNGKYLFMGYFKDKIEAAKAYDKKALELFGEFARPNFK